MINKKEIASVLIVIVTLSFLFSFSEPLKIILYTFLSVFLIISFNVLAKKVSAFYLDSEVEMSLWEVERFGFWPRSYFKKPIPMGIILPLLTALYSLGYFIWMGSLIFEIKPKTYRSAKRFGLYFFSEMAEYHIGLIAASGICINLLLGIAGYLLGFSEFARLNIFYAFFSIIPLSDLDGNKIFFGSFVLWSLLTTLVLLGLGYVFLVL